MGEGYPAQKKGPDIRPQACEKRRNATHDLNNNPSHFHVNSFLQIYPSGLKRLSRNALLSTETDDRDMAAAAKTGDSNSPKNG